MHDEVAERGWLGTLLGPSSLEPEGWEWYRNNGDFDQRAALRALRCPSFARFGGEDLSVAARVNAPLMRDALWFAGVEPAEVVVLPSCDHGLQEVVRDARGKRRPMHLAPGMHPGVWKAFGAFLGEL